MLTDLAAAREYAGGCADFYAAGAVDDCVSKLAALLGDESRQEAWGAAARRRAVERFSWEVVAERHRQVYAEVLAESRSPSG